MVRGQQKSAFLTRRPMLATLLDRTTAEDVLQDSPSLSDASTERPVRPPWSNEGIRTTPASGSRGASGESKSLSGWLSGDEGEEEVQGRATFLQASTRPLASFTLSPQPTEWRCEGEEALRGSADGALLRGSASRNSTPSAHLRWSAPGALTRDVEVEEKLRAAAGAVTEWALPPRLSPTKPPHFLHATSGSLQAHPVAISVDGSSRHTSGHSSPARGHTPQGLSYAAECRTPLDSVPEPPSPALSDNEQENQTPNSQVVRSIVMKGGSGIGTPEIQHEDEAVQKLWSSCKKAALRCSATGSPASSEESSGTLATPVTQQRPAHEEGADQPSTVQRALLSALEAGQPRPGSAGMTYPAAPVGTALNVKPDTAFAQLNKEGVAPADASPPAALVTVAMVGVCDLSLAHTAEKDGDWTGPSAEDTGGLGVTPDLDTKGLGAEASNPYLMAPPASPEDAAARRAEVAASAELAAQLARSQAELAANQWRMRRLEAVLQASGVGQGEAVLSAPETPKPPPREEEQPWEVISPGQTSAEHASFRHRLVTAAQQSLALEEALGEACAAAEASSAAADAAEQLYLDAQAQVQHLEAAFQEEQRKVEEGQAVLAAAHAALAEAQEAARKQAAEAEKRVEAAEAAVRKQAVEAEQRMTDAEKRWQQRLHEADIIAQERLSEAELGFEERLEEAQAATRAAAKRQAEAAAEEAARQVAAAREEAAAQLAEAQQDAAARFAEAVAARHEAVPLLPTAEPAQQHLPVPADTDSSLSEAAEHLVEPQQLSPLPPLLVEGADAFTPSPKANPASAPGSWKPLSRSIDAEHNAVADQIAEARLREMAGRAAVAEAEAVAVQAELAVAEEALQQLQAELKAANAAAAAGAEKAEAGEEKLAAAVSEEADAQRRISELQARLLEVQSVCDVAERRADCAERDRAELKELVNDLQTSLMALETPVKAAPAASCVAAAEELAAELASVSRRAQRERAAAEAHIAELEAELESASVELAVARQWSAKIRAGADINVSELWRKLIEAEERARAAARQLADDAAATPATCGSAASERRPGKLSAVRIRPFAGGGGFTPLPTPPSAPAAGDRRTPFTRAPSASADAEAWTADPSQRPEEAAIEPAAAAGFASASSAAPASLRGIQRSQSEGSAETPVLVKREEEEGRMSKAAAAQTAAAAEAGRKLRMALSPSVGELLDSASTPRPVDAGTCHPRDLPAAPQLTPKALAFVLPAEQPAASASAAKSPDALPGCGADSHVEFLARMRASQQIFGPSFGGSTPYQPGTATASVSGPTAAAAGAAVETEPRTADCSPGRSDSKTGTEALEVAEAADDRAAPTPEDAQQSLNPPTAAATAVEPDEVTPVTPPAATAAPAAPKAAAGASGREMPQRALAQELRAVLAGEAGQSTMARAAAVWRWLWQVLLPRVVARAVVGLRRMVDAAGGSLTAVSGEGRTLGLALAVAMQRRAAHLRALVLAAIAQWAAKLIAHAVALGLLQP